jgi:sortase A
MIRIAQSVRGNFFIWLRRVCLLTAIALLGYVGFAMVEAQIFQTYRGWRFDRAAQAAGDTVFAQTVSAVAPSAPQPEAGSSVARLEIPRLGISVMVLEGVDEDTLRHGIGHIPGTALPGAPGNVGIAGHRDTFFRPLRNVQPADVITLSTTTHTFQYQVDSITIVLPQDSAVLNDSGGALLTLVTCYPFYYVGAAPQRFIVHAHQLQAD